MWTETAKNGKVRYCERYKDPLTLKNKRVVVTFEKDTPANKKLAMQELCRKINEASYIQNTENVTFEQLYNAYMEYQLKEVKQSTYRRNYISLGHSIDIIGRNVIVDNANATYIISKYQEQNYPAGKINEFIVRLKAMIRWGYSNDYISNSKLLDKLKPLKDISEKEKIKDKYLEEDELSKLLEELNKPSTYHWYLFTKFLTASGLRIGEAIALLKSDINNNYISVSKTYDTINNIVTSPKTFTSKRDVYIQPELDEIIKEITKYTKLMSLEYGFRTDVFFPDKKGEVINYNSYRKALSIASNKALGRKITPHIFRHTHASLLLANGIELETISRRLGHEDSEITKHIYLHLTHKLKSLDEAQLKSVKIM